MSDIQPYESTRPGDLITADLFNRVQVKTREDILKQIRDAVQKHQYVDRAKNADALEGKTAKELTDAIVDQLKALVPGLTGYRVVYKRLQPDEPAVIRHGLKAYPLVDLYELARFPVVASADGRQWYDRVHWFLYHRTEMKIRRPEGASDAPPLVTIEESRGPVFKHRFEDVLTLHRVEYDGQTTLGDVVNEFWKKIFSDPNDPFDETSFANSPWIDRCCGDRRTVESLKRGGEWDDLFLKVVPRKTINSLSPVWPLGVEVLHYDLDTVGLVRADFARLELRALNQAFQAVGGGGDTQTNVETATQPPRPQGGVRPGVISDTLASALKDAVSRPPSTLEGIVKEDVIGSRQAEVDAGAAGSRITAQRAANTVEELAHGLEANVARAVSGRGHPEPGELFLMVLLKV